MKKINQKIRSVQNFVQTVTYDMVSLNISIRVAELTTERVSGPVLDVGNVSVWASLKRELNKGFEDESYDQN